MTYAGVDEFEIVGTEVDFRGGVGEDEAFEVAVWDLAEPLFVLCAAFRVEGGHGLAECKGLGYKQTVMFGGS